MIISYFDVYFSVFICSVQRTDRSASQTPEKGEEISCDRQMGKDIDKVFTHLFQSGWLGIGTIRVQEGSSCCQVKATEG